MLDLAGFRGELQHDVPLAPRTTWRIGGPAELWAVPKDIEDLLCLLRRARDTNRPVFILGNGSNILISGAGLPGITVHLGSGFEHVGVGRDTLRAGAGVLLPNVARVACEAGFAGFEHLIGIPGTVGGGIVGNAGSGGRDMRHILKSVTVISQSLELRTLEAEHLQLSYRCSGLQSSRSIVVEAAFNLEQTDDTHEIEARHRQILAERRRKFPLDLPSAGSVFKSRSGQPAGRLIEAAGLKGLRIGGAQVSKKHANFIVDLGGATAEDVKALIDTVREEVWANCSAVLEREIIYLPENGL